MNKFNKIFLGFLVFVTLTGCSLSFDDNKDVSEDNNIKVVDAINSFSNLSYSNEIVGYSSSTINSINKSILSENLLNFYDSNIESATIKYDYVIKNGILIISTETKISPWNASGNSEFYYFHFYDIKNDKELKSYDGLKALGFSDEDLLNNSSNCSFENGEPGNKCSIDAIKSDLNLESRSRCSKITVENGNIKLDLTNWCI